MEPPIHTEYFLSGGAMILIFIVGGAKAVISFCIRSAMPAKRQNFQFSLKFPVVITRRAVTPRRRYLRNYRRRSSCGVSLVGHVFLAKRSSAILTREHGGASGQHGVGVQVLPDVHVALHDRVVGGLVDASRFHSCEKGGIHECGFKDIREFLIEAKFLTW